MLSEETCSSTAAFILLSRNSFNDFFPDQLDFFLINLEIEHLTYIKITPCI